jgi:hypothetical protein
VRHRNFSPKSFQLNIIASRPGSYETVFELITNPTAMAIYGTLALGVGGNFLTDFIQSIFRRSVGKSPTESIARLEDDGTLQSGDLDALVEAIEPAMRESHKSVNYGASRIIIIKGDNNLVTFNESTKQYVNDSLKDDKVQIKLFSVGSFNANSRYGRAYDFVEGRTIPFQLARGGDRTTINTLLNSMVQYTRRRHLGDESKSAVAFQYRNITATDGRVKRMELLKVRPNISDFD